VLAYTQPFALSTVGKRAELVRVKGTARGE